MNKHFIITCKGAITTAITAVIVLALNTYASEPAVAHPGHGNAAPTHSHAAADKAQHAKGKVRSGKISKNQRRG